MQFEAVMCPHLRGDLCFVSVVIVGDNDQHAADALD